MTRRPPVSRRAILQIVVAVSAATVVIALLGHLHATVPTRELDFLVPGAADPRGADIDLFTCQRTLPDEEPRPRTAGEQPRPVGRISSSDVAACPDNFDPESNGGPIVEYVGEVVGDVLERERGVWVLMNDDAYALENGPLPAHDEFAGTNTGLTVWLPNEVVDPAALTPGRAGLRGDVLLVAGRVHRVDLEDGGGLTLRAGTAEILVDATSAPTPFHRRQALVAVLVAAVALGIVAYERSTKLP